MHEDRIAGFSHLHIRLAYIKLYHNTERVYCSPIYRRLCHEPTQKRFRNRMPQLSEYPV